MTLIIKYLIKERAALNHLQNSEEIIRNSLKNAFENALQKKFPRYRRKYHKGVGISIGSKPPEYKVFMVDSPTDRMLNNLRIDKKKDQIIKKIKQIENDYVDLNNFMSLKFRTMGTMLHKLHLQKSKVIV
jgi:endonuclease III-like uncharacterized protein